MGRLNAGCVALPHNTDRALGMALSAFPLCAQNLANDMQVRKHVPHAFALACLSHNFVVLVEQERFWVARCNMITSFIGTSDDSNDTGNPSTFVSLEERPVGLAMEAKG